MRQQRLAISLLLLTVNLTACMPSDIGKELHRYAVDLRLVDNSQLGYNNNWILPRDSRILVVSGPGLKTDEVNYQAALTNEVYQVFTARFPYTQRYPSVQPSLLTALNTARNQRHQFVLYTQLLFFDDKAGNWVEFEYSEDIRRVGPDRISARLTLVEISSEYIVDSILLQSNSGWLSFYNDKPDQLFREPIEDYANSLTPQ
ncbi:DUF4823 domain-containing protein [Spartinivicinus poritis]|uniref:DUF4823 domain-containing protein n=1 Tax=Spartinivicinus poritis TaxID=2994640 RepID=A0ABT5UHM3_9GAMM|nr:DUF4823 domain-containing protein [Spartinivicinus sp. A2-2]MDE1464519.1 DUF4823 domain-containing protein [Spartinivicinus sp. A2-2]